MPILFLPPTLPAPPIAAGQALALDLPGALQRIRDASPRLKAARARIEERRGGVQTARADGLPQFTLASDFTRSRDASGAWSASRSAPGVPDLASAGSPSNTFTARATLSQAIFHGGRLTGSLEVARLGEQEAELARATSEREVLHVAAETYLSALSAQEALEVVQVRLEVAERFRKDIQARREVQMATELDRLRAESEYQAAYSERLKAQTALQRALETLCGQLGLEPRTPVTLRGLGDPPIAWGQAPGTRSELAQLERQEQMCRANARVIGSELRPQLDFNASYGTQAPQRSSLFKAPYESWTVNLSLRVPLFDGLRTRGRAAQNRAQLEQVVQTRVDQQRAIDVENAAAELEVGSSLAYLESTERAHRSAEEALRTTREAFTEGLVTSLELLQAHREERQREGERRVAILGVWRAGFALRRAKGLPPL